MATQGTGAIDREGERPRSQGTSLSWERVRGPDPHDATASQPPTRPPALLCESVGPAE